MLKAFTQEAEVRGFSPPQPKAVPAQICNLPQEHRIETPSSRSIKTGVA